MHGVVGVVAVGRPIGVAVGVSVGVAVAEVCEMWNSDVELHLHYVVECMLVFVVEHGVSRVMVAVIGSKHFVLLTSSLSMIAYCLLFSFLHHFLFH